MQQPEKIFDFQNNSVNLSKQTYVNNLIAVIVCSLATICLALNISRFTVDHKKEANIFKDYPEINMIKTQLENNLANHGQFLYSQEPNNTNYLSIIVSPENNKTFGCRIKAGNIVATSYDTDINKACSESAYNFNGFIHDGEQQYIRQKTGK